jgi:hypothetical protein
MPFIDVLSESPKIRLGVSAGHRDQMSLVFINGRAATKVQFVLRLVDRQ